MTEHDDAQDLWQAAIARGLAGAGPECNALERRINLHIAELHDIKKD